MGVDTGPGEGAGGRLYGRPGVLKNTRTHYCPGCTHGVIHRLVAEVIEELGLRERTVGVASVGCSVLLYDYIDCDMIEAAHGRAPAVATGVKRVHPDHMVFTYQGDGDYAAIGTAESIHAASRGERITTIFINNAIYGMTGGQMAPTTLLDQVTATTPSGREREKAGGPLDMSRVVATIPGAVYVARVAPTSPAGIRRAREYITRAVTLQLEGRGYSLVEVLSACPTNWGLDPDQALDWVDEKMVPAFPPGILKDGTGGGEDDG